MTGVVLSGLFALKGCLLPVSAHSRKRSEGVTQRLQTVAAPLGGLCHKYPNMRQQPAGVTAHSETELRFLSTLVQYYAVDLLDKTACSVISTEEKEQNSDLSWLC